VKSPLIIYSLINNIFGVAVVETKSDKKPLAPIDLTEYFDKIEVEVQADLSDWHIGSAET
jgi:hypothetical protein